MSARAKDNKVACVFRRLFKSPDQKKKATDNGASGGSDSPARRLVRRGVSPAQAPSRSGAMGPPVDHTIRARRLLKEYKEIQKLNSSPDPNFTVDLVNDSLYQWSVKLHRRFIDQDSPLAKDMAQQDVQHILLNLTFPDNFPFAPPFMRVVEPRIEKGFVMDGGAICLELLTSRGWASAYTVEALLMQFGSSLVKGQGRIAKSGGKEFSRRTAEAAFKTLSKTHEKYGWVTPELADG